MKAKRSPAKQGNGRREAVTWELVRDLALRLPATEESTSYGTPAVKVRGKLMLRLREDGEAFVMAVDFVDRELLMAEQPEIFYITDHYLNYPLVLVRLATVREDQLSDLLRQAWRRVAPRRLVSEFDAFSADT